MEANMMRNAFKNAEKYVYNAVTVENDGPSIIDTFRDKVYARYPEIAKAAERVNNVKDMVVGNTVDRTKAAVASLGDLVTSASAPANGLQMQ